MKKSDEESNTPPRDASCPLCRAPMPTDDKTLRERLAVALSVPMDPGTVLDPTDERLKAFSQPERRRIIAAMCACEGISTPMLEATCPSWLDTVKMVEEQIRELRTQSETKRGLPVEEFEKHLRGEPSVAFSAVGATFAVTPKPVAWYRIEDGLRVYYETEAWPNMTPLYTVASSATERRQGPVDRRQNDPLAPNAPYRRMSAGRRSGDAERREAKLVPPDRKATKP